MAQLSRTHGRIDTSGRRLVIGRKHYTTYGGRGSFWCFIFRNYSPCNFLGPLIRWPPGRGKRRPWRRRRRRRRCQPPPTLGLERRLYPFRRLFHCFFLRTVVRWWGVSPVPAVCGGPLGGSGPTTPAVAPAGGGPPPRGRWGAKSPVLPVAPSFPWAVVRMSGDESHPNAAVLADATDSSRTRLTAAARLGRGVDPPSAAGGGTPPRRQRR